MLKWSRLLTSACLSNRYSNNSSNSTDGSYRSNHNNSNRSNSKNNSRSSRSNRKSIYKNILRSNLNHEARPLSSHGDAA